MHKNDSIKKYTTLYMSLGICFGVSIGLVFGRTVYSDNMSLGICFGLPIGMCIGAAIGAAKDKRLSENMMRVCKIETLNDSADVMIYVVDKNNIEKEYKVTEKMMKQEKYSVNDRVAEETDGLLEIGRAHV